MKARRLEVALWLSATLSTAAIAFSAGRQSFPPIPPGERILNSSCLACHELRRIETTALDQAGWTKIVRTMVEKGAEVQADDVSVLVNYLTLAYGPLPDGPGKAVMLEVCTQCHTLDRIKARGASPEEWDEVLMHMLNEGAPLSDNQYPVILNYLARHFGPF